MKSSKQDKKTHKMHSLRRKRAPEYSMLEPRIALKEMETLSAKWSKGREVLSGQASTQESEMSGKRPRDFSGPKKRNRSKVMYVKFKEGVRLHPGRTAEFGSTSQLV